MNKTLDDRKLELEKSPFDCYCIFERKHTLEP